MAKGTVNKVIIVGSLGADAELRYTGSGSAVANIRVATTESWKDKSGAQKTETEWHSVVVYGKLAEICGEYLRKGSKAYFEGKLKTRKWQDKSGQDRYTTEIVADEMQMLSKPPTSNPLNHGESMREEMAPAHGQYDDLDGDIPF